MICTGYVVNAPDELHEGYYNIGFVVVNKSDSLEIYNCLGPSIGYVKDKIKSGDCGYSGIDKSAALKLKKIGNQTLVYNNKKTIKLTLGFQTPNDVYQLDGKYYFWGGVIPQMYYQINCRARLK